jgi:hypothetical protein
MPATRSGTNRFSAGRKSSQNGVVGKRRVGAAGAFRVRSHNLLHLSSGDDPVAVGELDGRGAEPGMHHRAREHLEAPRFHVEHLGGRVDRAAGEV